MPLFVACGGASSDGTLAQYPLAHEDYVELLPDAQTQHFNNNIPSVILEIDGSAFRQRNRLGQVFT